MPRGGYEYDIGIMDLTWTKAKEFCETWGGELALIIKPDDEAFLRDAMAVNCPQLVTNNINLHSFDLHQRRRRLRCSEPYIAYMKVQSTQIFETQFIYRDRVKQKQQQTVT